MPPILPTKPYAAKSEKTSSVGSQCLPPVLSRDIIIAALTQGRALKMIDYWGAFVACAVAKVGCARSRRSLP
jgi:hypothetical protein